MPATWQHTIVGQSILKGTAFEKMMVKNGIDATAIEGVADTPYKLPAMQVNVHHPEVNVPVLWWRSVGHTHTAFVMETLIDQLASAAKMDPIAYRLALLDPKLKLREKADPENIHRKYEPISGYRSPVKVDEVDTPKIRLYVEKRQRDGQSASSINRELNIIGATLHEAEEFFSELKQWKSPKIPRLKVSKSRREKIIIASTRGE